jgi:hypothetical protein
MRKVIAISAFVFTFAVVFAVQWYSVQAGEDHGKLVLDNYLDRSNHGAEKVKFHLALKLTTGNWNDEQRAIMLRAVNDRTSVSEAEIWAAFPREDAIAVFYNVGSAEISDLVHIYNTPIGKSAIVHDWNLDRKHKLWQQNVALGLVRYADKINPEQQQFLVDFAAAIPTITRENAEQWNQRAVDLKLPRQVGRGILTTIGDDRCPGQFASLGKKLIQPNCVCTMSAGNWSCNDSCHGAGSCHLVEGDCGILWLYDCDGMCNNGDMEIQ